MVIMIMYMEASVKWGWNWKIDPKGTGEQKSRDEQGESHRDRKQVQNCPISLGNMVEAVSWNSHEEQNSRSMYRAFILFILK